ncbi:MAG: reverse transcriptase domain-containing protein [Methylophilaceae bacterium]
MKRWHIDDMVAIGKKLFEKIYKKRRCSRHNHDIHHLAREINDWLPNSIQAMIDGTYTPRPLKRRYFPDEMIDQLHLSDRILQHILLRQLKSTVAHITNPNCVHIHGPSGVKVATKRIREALKTNEYHYIIRADIKSFYKSIPQHKLVDDLKKTYDDPSLIRMFEEIIKNPIETPRGYKNAVTGIALRGPLSQLFSAIYLKSLDDAFNHMDVTYIRYQDDLIVLCKTKRQLNRCRRKMMNILRERHLTLSCKKTRIGSIEKPFHFLGIDYPGTQPLEDTTVKPEDLPSDARKATPLGGGQHIN